MKKVIAALLCLMMLTLCACENEKKMEISETPLRARTCEYSFSCDCRKPLIEGYGHDIDVNLQFHQEYQREGASPTRTLQLLDREWELTYQHSQRCWSSGVEGDLYQAADGSGTSVWYVAGTESIVRISFGRDEAVDLWRPEGFTPDEAGYRAYADRICAYFGVDTSDFVVEYSEGEVLFSKYQAGVKIGDTFGFTFNEEGMLDFMALPVVAANEGTATAEELSQFTEENVINAILHRIEPLTLDGVYYTNMEVSSMSFLWLEGKLCALANVDISYKVPRRLRDQFGDSFSGSFVLDLA
ncbi:MAG: hypothetical protein E7644_07165 [Ruminococcaceae bacterium]|nr:hypothetical protein [Oscillospiraceae bacterium]